MLQITLKKVDNLCDIRLAIREVSVDMVCIRMVPEFFWSARSIIEQCGVIRMNVGIAHPTNQQNGTRGQACNITPRLNLMEVISSSPCKNHVCYPEKHIHCRGKPVRRNMKHSANSYFNN